MDDYMPADALDYDFDKANTAFAQLDGGKFRLFLAESVISFSELYPDEMLVAL